MILDKDEYLLRDKKAFQEIADVMAEKVPGVESIKLDRFDLDGHDHEYIVVVFKGGAMSVRNARWNSLVNNLKELANLLQGSYYAEVEFYKEAKKQLEAQSKE